jgi:hypothetical protein
VNGQATFAKRHLGAKQQWTRDAHVEDARREIVERFAVEELAYHRLIVHKPLSPCRPMRPAAAPARCDQGGVQKTLRDFGSSGH